MTEHDAWTERLSEYLDGELTTEERYAVESHLQGCDGCATVLEDLRRVVGRAHTMPPRPPQTDLWTGIAERIGADRGRPNVVPFLARAPRRITFTLPQLAAASLLIAAISGGFVWAIRDRSARANLLTGGAGLSGPRALHPTAQNPPGGGPGFQGPPYNDRTGGFTVPPEAANENAGPGTRNAEPVVLADTAYDAAVSDLERALKQGRGHLDAATIATVEHNLQTIDEAIRQAREALAADPANTYLSSHLVEARRRKLDLLRRATELTEMD